MGKKEKYKLKLNIEKVRKLMVCNNENAINLSKRASVARQTLYKGLRGEGLSLTTVIKIAMALNVKVDDIILKK